jgi:hypothetical protein
MALPDALIVESFDTSNVFVFSDFFQLKKLCCNLIIDFDIAGLSKVFNLNGFDRDFIFFFD